MKNLIFGSLFMLTLVVTGCQTEGESLDTAVVNNPQSASENAESVALPTLKFDKELYDFGTITQGEKVHITYTFVNAGDADLVITSAKGSCGCTVPDWPKQPIEPGASGELKVVFNSEGKSGKQHKKVFISANTQPSENEVALTGEVLTPEVK